jgi:hypothetical protein
VQRPSLPRPELRPLPPPHSSFSFSHFFNALWTLEGLSELRPPGPAQGQEGCVGCTIFLKSPARPAVTPGLLAQPNGPQPVLCVSLALLPPTQDQGHPVPAQPALSSSCTESSTPPPTTAVTSLLTFAHVPRAQQTPTWPLAVHSRVTLLRAALPKIILVLLLICLFSPKELTG